MNSSGTLNKTQEISSKGQYKIIQLFHCEITVTETERVNFLVCSTDKNMNTSRYGLNKIRSLAPVMSVEPVDGFLQFKWCLEAEKILYNLYAIDF